VARAQCGNFHAQENNPPVKGRRDGLSGRHINVGLDGIVEMSEGGALCLIPLGWTILGDA
jgi:hypothetical protein